jgi:hypothetical protein
MGRSAMAKSLGPSAQGACRITAGLAAASPS